MNQEKKIIEYLRTNTEITTLAAFFPIRKGVCEMTRLLTYLLIALIWVVIVVLVAWIIEN